MATVMVPVEVPDKILARFDAIGCRIPNAGEWIVDEPSWIAVVATANFTTRRIILRPKVQWPEWFKMRWVFRDRLGKWHRAESKPRQLTAVWRCVSTVYHMHGLDTSWLPDVPWQESLFENPNWKGEA